MNDQLLQAILGELRVLNRTQKLFNKGDITVQNSVPAGIATTGSAVEIELLGCSTIGIQTKGTYTGALSVQVTLDGITWVTLGGTPIADIATGVMTATITSAAQSIFQVDVAGALKARVTGLAAMTGTAIVFIMCSNDTSVVSVESSAPTTSSITSVTPGTGSTALGKAEDAVHASGDVGTMDLGVRYETLATPNAAGDYGFMQVDDLSKLVVMPYAPPVNQIQGTTAAITTTADTLVIAAQAAGVRNYITSITIVNSSATATVVELKDGVTVIWRGYVPANGYNDAQFPTPLKGTAATAINVACLTTATNTFVTCAGFRAI